MKKTQIGFTIVTAVIAVLIIIFLANHGWDRFFASEEEEEIIAPKIVTLQDTASYSALGNSGQMPLTGNLDTKVPMEVSEIVIAVLNRENEQGISEEQFAVYRNTSDLSTVYITYLAYDKSISAYKRVWDMPVTATRGETISIYSQDLIGDRNNCIVVTGMNTRNEHTMTIFRRSSAQGSYRKIAELQIAGSIVIREASRTLAYQQGISRGRSYDIATHGQDPRSTNMMDQVETIYSYNPGSQQYEQSSVTRIPGSQLEQRRLRELLSGAPGVFENFIQGLWYYVSPRGTIDTKQYLYFDPAGKEVIFYGDEAQQIFHWQTSTPTRYGLYIRSQNISISTLLRFIDIEMESMDRVKLRVTEDVRLKITISTTWDGSYRRASASTAANNGVQQVVEAVDALYDSSWGRLQFNSTGEYTITQGGNARKGRYVFFKVEGNELLEMRPDDPSESNVRMVYKIDNVAGVRILSRVRLGTNGIQDLLEPPITLTKIE